MTNQSREDTWAPCLLSTITTILSNIFDSYNITICLSWQFLDSKPQELYFFTHFNYTFFANTKFDAIINIPMEKSLKLNHLGENSHLVPLWGWQASSQTKSISETLWNGSIKHYEILCENTEILPNIILHTTNFILNSWIL